MKKIYLDKGREKSPAGSRTAGRSRTVERERIPYKSQTIRLNRYVASSGICSRREADDLISSGQVQVNKQVITELGTQVKLSDEVRVKGKVIRNERKVYILLNKPKDTITTTNDPENRNTVMHLIAQATDQRVFPVGRLDRNTTGVLLLTNDGDLAARLTHPRYGVRKIYEVSLNKGITDEDLEKLKKGVELEDGLMKTDLVTLLSPENRKELSVEIHSGKNRVIRRMFEALGYDIIRLDRVFFAGLTKKNLSRGKWRHLSTREVGWLKMKNHGS